MGRLGPEQDGCVAWRPRNAQLLKALRPLSLPMASAPTLRALRLPQVPLRSCPGGPPARLTQLRAAHSWPPVLPVWLCTAEALGPGPWVRCRPLAEEARGRPGNAPCWWFWEALVRNCCWVKGFSAQSGEGLEPAGPDWWESLHKRGATHTTHPEEACSPRCYPSRPGQSFPGTHQQTCKPRSSCPSGPSDMVRMSGAMSFVPPGHT